MSFLNIPITVLKYYPFAIISIFFLNWSAINKNHKIKSIFFHEQIRYSPVLDNDHRGVNGTEIETSTDIEGIVNDYAVVEEIIEGCADQLEIDDTTPFFPGDRVMIIQMKGAVINMENSANFGNIISIENAGNYEFATVSNIIGNTIILNEKLNKNYSPADVVQLVRVPVYDDVNIIGELTCQPWNGSTGGILALEVNGTLRVCFKI